MKNISEVTKSLCTMIILQYLCTNNIYNMEYVFLVLAIILCIIGIIGAILPMLPGPPISYAGLWMLWIYDNSYVSATTLWVTGIIMVIVTVIDYIAPIWMTDLSGGSKYSTRGATIGLVAGLFFSPWGLIVGPFLGALVGELLAHAQAKKALKVAMMSFVAFLLTTGLKLIYGTVLLIMVAVEIIAGI